MYEGFTFLMLAAIAKNLEILKFLLDLPGGPFRVLHPSKIRSRFDSFQAASTQQRVQVREPLRRVTTCRRQATKDPQAASALQGHERTREG